MFHICKDKGLTAVLNEIGRRAASQSNPDSEIFAWSNLEDMAYSMGIKLKEKYSSIRVAIPIKEKYVGLNISVDGAKFKGYILLQNGILVEKNIARKVDISGEAYLPHDSMTLSMPDP